MEPEVEMSGGCTDWREIGIFLFDEAIEIMKPGTKSHASGGFDCWLVPNKGSPVLDKAGNQIVRKHTKGNRIFFWSRGG